MAVGCGLISTMAGGHGNDHRVATIVCNLLVCETPQEFLDSGFTAIGSTVIDLLGGRYASRRRPETWGGGRRTGTGGGISLTVTGPELEAGDVAVTASTEFILGPGRYGLAPIGR